MPDEWRAIRFGQAAWARVVVADRVLRIHFLSFSGLWPLLGASTVLPQLRAGQLAVLLAVTFCFHVYTMLFNDVVDLPIDRTQPKRQRDPLVRGTIKPWQVMAVALVQPLLTVPLSMWLGAPPQAQATLGAGFALMGAYNLWGKRCPFPPLTDAIQGMAWGSLAVYGACAFGAPNRMTWMVAAYAAAFTLIFNGIHGPLRDLDNDFAHGARTTAIFLGAHPGADGGHAPRAMTIFAAGIRAILIGILAALLILNEFGYSPVTWAASALAAVVMSSAIVRLHPKVVRPRRPEWEVAFRLDLFLLTTSLLVVFLAHLSAPVLLTLMLLNALALALFPATPAVVRWTWHAIVAAARPPHGRTVTSGVPRTD